MGAPEKPCRLCVMYVRGQPGWLDGAPRGYGACALTRTATHANQRGCENYAPKVGVGSHWEGCETAHHDCALSKLAKVTAEVECLKNKLNKDSQNFEIECKKQENALLRADRDRLHGLIKEWADATVALHQPCPVCDGRESGVCHCGEVSDRHRLAEFALLDEVK